MVKSAKNDTSLLVYLPVLVKQKIRIAAATAETDMSSYVAEMVIEDLWLNHHLTNEQYSALTSKTPTDRSNTEAADASSV